MTPEGKNKAYLLKTVKALGGICRKVRWEGRIGAPDWLVMLDGRSIWIELKAPHCQPRASQCLEFALMQQHGGITVHVCDCPRAIDKALFSSNVPKN